jgi:hypothetical protein
MVTVVCIGLALGAGIAAFAAIAKKFTKPWI